MEKKYKLTEETKEWCGHTLHRIEALKDFGDVKTGDKGGWIEKETNLSHADNAWVGGSACVGDSARVSGSACVSDSACVYGEARVGGEARVSDSACVYDSARVGGSARVYGEACVGDSACVSDSACVYDSACVGDSARVYGSACVSGSAWVGGSACVGDSARVYGEACVGDSACVSGSAWVGGSARVSGSADYIVFRNWWGSGRFFTWTRSNNMWRVGCFYGTGEELIKKAYADSEKSGREYERIVKYVESILADEEKNKE